MRFFGLKPLKKVKNKENNSKTILVLLMNVYRDLDDHETI